jgi:hypothetical protein
LLSAFPDPPMSVFPNSQPPSMSEKDKWRKNPYHESTVILHYLGLDGAKTSRDWYSWENVQLGLLADFIRCVTFETYRGSTVVSASSIHFCGS